MGLMQTGLAAMIVALAAAPAHAQAGVPKEIEARVNELVARCASAGGTLGSMRGEGRFVIPADFTGDGRLDFLVSEGNVPCTGRPALFRPDGLARVELWVRQADGSARLAFADRLLAYRVLAGPPAKLQIARRGPACGAPRCGDELVWNAGAARFDMVPTDGRRIAVAAAPGASAPAPTASAAPAPAPAAPVAVAAGPAPTVQPGAEARFRDRCRKAYLAQGPQAARWADGACADDWKKVVAAGPMADALLAATSGPPPTLAEARARVAAVRWGPGDRESLASGRLGPLEAWIEGRGRPEMLGLRWQGGAEEVPYDVPGALEARGATLTLTACEKTGVGEGARTWSVSAPGRQPFALEVYQRTAPTGFDRSSYSATVRVDGQPARRGATRCEQFW